MRSDVDIRAVAESLVSRMPDIRLTDTMQESGRFRLAGRLPGRSLLVVYKPAAHPSWEYLLTLEEADGDRPTPAPLLAAGWIALHAYAIGWLTPRPGWPAPDQELKVSRRMIQMLQPGGDTIRCALAPGAPLPEELQGYYAMPGVNQGVPTGPEQWVLDQLRAWAAMGWRTRGLEPGLTVGTEVGV